MSDSLAPGLLIASPPLGDPNFDRSVVLLALHSEDGALGFVINRASPISLGELFEHAGFGEGLTDPAPVWIGGPVQPSSAWVLFDEPELEAGEGVIAVGERLRISSSRIHFDRIVEEARIGEKGEPALPRRMVILGYAGWGPQQLETEISRGAWLPVPLGEQVVFDVAPEKRWEQAYALLGLRPADMMTMRGVGQA